MKTPPFASFRRRLILVWSFALAILVAAGVFAYVLVQNNRVYIDTATITAPLISLAPTVAGSLNAVYVKEGDSVAANAPVAEVGNQVITAQVAGLIVKVNDTVGAEVQQGSAVVSMIDPKSLRVVGSIDEDKGLSQVAVGDPVVFTVDAFGSKQFTGVVDEIAPTANSTDVVFSVSDKRAVQTFDVKARFDTTVYQELKNGMSARMWIYR